LPTKVGVAPDGAKVVATKLDNLVTTLPFMLRGIAVPARMVLQR